MLKKSPNATVLEYCTGNIEEEVARRHYTCIRDPFNTFLFLSSSHVRFHIRITAIQRVCPSAPEKKKLPTSGKPTTVTRNESLLRFKMLIISVRLLFQVLKQCGNLPCYV